jgi:ligand-binding SRPBCC domain-containing protein
MRAREVAVAAGVAAVGTVAAVLAKRRGSLGEPSFSSRFVVRAPLEAVAQFHSDPRALTRLTPPPTVMRVHRMDPLAEGSVSEFTMWVGPIPIRWRAVHSAIDHLKGFTDTQELGPMARWVHRHSYRALDARRTEVTDQIWYEHPEGWRGLLTPLLFSALPLRALFQYRAWVTRRALQRAQG